MTPLYDFKQLLLSTIGSIIDDYVSLTLKSTYTVDSAFNELGYNKLSEFLNIHLFKSDFFKQRYYYEGGQDIIFPWSLEFR